MPLPAKKPGEAKDKFISRCVSKLTELGEGKDAAQRVAICATQFDKNTRAEILKVFTENLLKETRHD